VASKKWQNRALFLGVSSLLIIVAMVIILKVFNDNIVFFYSPSELAKKGQITSFIRVGGMVKQGSVDYLTDDTLEFTITDFENDLVIRYKGILPNLFKEGQGTVAYGRLGEGGVFIAEELLAKHDENYMPPEVAKTLNKS
jgi:cytochrome c-type biogenesis protein CcmE